VKRKKSNFKLIFEAGHETTIERSILAVGRLMTGKKSENNCADSLHHRLLQASHRHMK
jgi:hypothetical protein